MVKMMNEMQRRLEALEEKDKKSQEFNEMNTKRINDLEA